MKPWLKYYGEDVPESIEPVCATPLSYFARAVERVPRRPFIYYFDNAITFSEADALADALAAGLAAAGVEAGGRVAVYMQNMPQFIITLLASWKLGAIAVTVNPMLKSLELQKILNDSGATVLVALDEIYVENAATIIADTPVHHVITTSALEFNDTNDRPAMLAGYEPVTPPGCTDWMMLIGERRGEQPAKRALEADDVALLVYTSGTTGPAKGAMVTHGNISNLCEMARIWNHMDDNDVVLTIAPLFHITGLILGFAFALPEANPVVLHYRFDPVLAASLVRRYEATYTVAAVTAYIAMLNSPDVDVSDLASLKRVASGGAPNPPSVIEAFEQRFGIYLLSGYGLTESTAPTHGVPPGLRAPVDPESGALSIGIPMPNVDARIIDDDGETLPPGEIGEIALRSPGIVAGYWNKPEESANAIRDHELRTGDVGFMNDDGWFFIVDRKKDMIIASGYKVWPREVEDVLYQYPGVREAAVVGVADDYRGETVKAFVSLKAGVSSGPADLLTHCRDLLAAYKRPAEIIIVDEIPKNASGKILRRELR